MVMIILQEVDLAPDRDAVGKIHAAAKAAVLRKKSAIAKDINLLDSHINASNSGHDNTPCLQPTIETHGGIENGQNDGGSDEDNGSSDDELPVPSGFLSAIKAFVPAEKQPVAPKQVAPKSTTPKAKASPKAKAGAGAAPSTASNQSTRKVTIGQASTPAAKRQKNTEEPSFPKVPATSGTGGLDSDMTEADREVVTLFGERLNVLKNINPPVADGPFKTYLTDINSSLATLKGELKAKRRSAVRRTDKERDPLYISLGEMSNDVDSFMHIIKCILVVSLSLQLFIFLSFR